MHPLPTTSTPAPRRLAAPASDIDPCGASRCTLPGPPPLDPGAPLTPSDLDADRRDLDPGSREVRDLAVGPALPWLVVGVALLCCPVPGAVALLLGAVLARIRPLPAPGHRMAPWLLKASVVLLGASVQIPRIVELGAEALLPSAALVALSLLVTGCLATRLGVPRRLALLVGVGTGICGGAAIAATAPVIGSKPREIQRALSAIFVLNAVALVVFPVLGPGLGLGAEEFGRWCALAVHDTSSVVGAAATHGAQALEVATVTKLTRTLWLIPVALLLGWRARRTGADPKGRGAPFPGFLLAFVAAAGVASLLPPDLGHATFCADRAREVSRVALLGIGAAVPLGRIEGGALRTGLLAVTVWVVVTAVALLLVCDAA